MAALPGGLRPRLRILGITSSESRVTLWNLSFIYSAGIYWVLTMTLALSQALGMSWWANQSLPSGSQPVCYHWTKPMPDHSQSWEGGTESPVRSEDQLLPHQVQTAGLAIGLLSLPPFSLPLLFLHVAHMRFHVLTHTVPWSAIKTAHLSKLYSPFQAWLKCHLHCEGISGPPGQN